MTARQPQNTPTFLGGYGAPLLIGTFIRRYKRFFADVHVPESNKTITAHCPDTGRMTGLLKEGCPALLSHSSNPRRKLAFTLEGLRAGNTWACVNTQRANSLMQIILSRGLLPPLLKYSSFRREAVFHPGTRFDFQLKKAGAEDAAAWLEVKSVTLRSDDGSAMFPDAVTLRGRKHLDALVEARNLGSDAFLVLMCMRNDCRRFRPAAYIDPAYAQALQHAVDCGVVCLTPVITMNKRGFYLSARPLPFYQDSLLQQ